MSTVATLQPITFYGEAVMVAGVPVLVRINELLINGDRYVPDQDLTLTKRGLCMTECLFAIGDLVVIIDGRNIKTSVGSPAACQWTSAKQELVGKTAKIIGFSDDGDVELDDGELLRGWISPAFLRKYALFKAGDVVGHNQYRFDHWTTKLSDYVGTVTKIGAQVTIRLADGRLRDFEATSLCFLTEKEIKLFDSVQSIVYRFGGTLSGPDSIAGFVEDLLRKNSQPE